MAKRICSVAGCSRPHYGSGYCQLHYDRVRRTGEPGAVEAGRRGRGQACSVRDCTRPVKARGFCYGHWRRWRNTGDPGDAEFRTLTALPDVCVVVGCDRQPRVRGWCQMHWLRWYKTGDPGCAESRLGGYGIDYSGAHYRVYAQRGHAAHHLCAHCSRQAENWAYDNSDQHAQIADDGRPFSLDPQRYIPLCISCHKLFDQLYSISARVPTDQWPVIRAWARQTGLTVSDRGRVARKVVVAYMEANSPTWA